MRIELRIILLFSLLTAAWATGTESDLLTPRLSAVRPASSSLPLYIESTVDSNYSIGPGDVFDLYVEGASFSAQVSPEGAIGVEGVGVIQVQSLTLNDAKKAILSALGSRFGKNACYVQLSQLKRFRVPIYGAVQNSGQYPVDSYQRLSVLLRATGGALPLADLSKIKIMRGGDSLIVNLAKVDRNGDSSGDPIMLQGDMVYVPYRSASDDVVSIDDGQTLTALPLQSKWTVTEYLQQSGFYNKDRLPARIRLLDADGSLLQEGAYQKLASYSSDKPFTIVIPNHELIGKRRVYVAGMVGVIGAVEYNPGFSPMDYIAAAGVTPFSASLSQIEVVRYSNAERESIDPVKGEVFPGDVLELPRSRYERMKDFTVFLATLLGVLSSTLVIYQAYK